MLGLLAQLARANRVLLAQLAQPNGVMKDDRYWHCLDQAMEASHGGHTDEAMAWFA